MKMNTSKLEALKAKKEKRKGKLSKAENEKKAKEAAAKKKRKARPKSAEEKDYERLPGSVTVDAGSNGKYFKAKEREHRAMEAL